MMGGKKDNLIGHKYGLLTVLDRVSNMGREIRWFCKCECGKFSCPQGTGLKSGHTKSCGCLKKLMMTKHGDLIDSRHKKRRSPRLYSVWLNMKGRCKNPKLPDYHWYGERGIELCKEWCEYLNFKNWAVNHGYADNLTIDRKDNNGNYEPINCHWITMKENLKKRILYKDANGKFITNPGNRSRGVSVSLRALDGQKDP